MIKLLGTTALLMLLMTQSANAEFIASLGTNPFNADFSRTIVGPLPLGGNFEDQYTFSVTSGPVIATALAVNTWDNQSQEINDFAGEIFRADGTSVLGPVFGTPCLNVVDCQSLSGIGELVSGDYYLLISGKASNNGDYIYTGSLTVAVPAPIAGARNSWIDHAACRPLPMAATHAHPAKAVGIHEQPLGLLESLKIA